MFPSEISNLPGQIDAALQFLRFAEELQHPHSFDSTPREGRDLAKTELEVKDSALTVLLEYFNHPVPAPEQRQSHQPSSAIGKPDNLSSDIECEECVTVCNREKFFHRRLFKLERNTPMLVGIVGPDYWVGKLYAVADHSELLVQPVDKFIECLFACCGMLQVIRNRANPPFKRVI